jgi:hypothetical protein
MSFLYQISYVFFLGLCSFASVLYTDFPTILFLLLCLVFYNYVLVVCCICVLFILPLLICLDVVLFLQLAI